MPLSDDLRALENIIACALRYLKPGIKFDLTFWSVSISARNGGRMKNRFVVLAVMVPLLIGVRQLSAQESSQEQCSLAVLSQRISNQQLVCSSNVVQQMALRGHAFEQNQLGMASMLVIGPE